ncbi:MAG: hypothetical protein E2P02_16495 [Acidobacteria bacterium]|nr:MAG: hypothetical protein E2P02_16495 [Acidobacteriota bacterium]
MKRIWFALLLLLVSQPTLRAQESSPGQVQIPLEIYTQLLKQAQSPDDPRAPVNFALGNAQVNVVVRSTEPQASAEISVTLSIQIFEDRWALVPVLPAGTPVSRVTIQGSPVQLVAAPQGLAWTTHQKGAYTMELTYRVDASASNNGYVLAVPVPEAASINLSANLPGTGLDVAVIPAAGMTTKVSGGTTHVTATVPSARGFQISWRTPSKLGAAFSRALYSGKLSGDSVVWRGEFRVELFSDETVKLQLLPRGVTLTNLQVDGKEASILVDGKHFATLVKGRGVHRVVASFQTPVIQSDGPPRVELDLPKVPVSRFELTLPGRKELSAQPGGSATTQTRAGGTIATVHVPLTGHVSLTWSESVPDVVRRELRANASLYHIVSAEEGVLLSRVRVLYEVRRGETNRLELVVPADVQVNQVSSETGAIADWRLTLDGNAQLLQIFLDRQIQGELLFDVFYDRSLTSGESEALPLLTARGVGRQRGMVALLSSRELTLDPVDEGASTRVGENQLPSFVRDEIELTIAHTFKYTDAPPSMTVAPSVPERVAGRFDAQVDSLLSLGDVTLTSAASVEIHVKSGGVDQMELVLPEGANLLNLSAPSLRSHRISDDDDRVVELEFTQEMEGHFRIELSYERILGEDEIEIDASTLRVRGADVEQGRIAVEALSAAEVTPSATDELSPIEVNELPRQLVLQTTNPILLAFKYVRAEPEPRLALRVTRHRVVDVQEATIDSAEYKTLFTRDGLSVTTVRFMVRNARKQFLRIDLPEDSEVWSVFVAGRPEKPALAEGEDENGSLLIKIVNRTEGFPVDLIFATRAPSIGRLGTVRARLPRPDILVTDTRWDLYLPEGLDYRPATSNLNVTRAQAPVSHEDMERALSQLNGVANAAPLHITVPATGVHFAFHKLYANQGDVEAYASIPYATKAGTALGQFVSLLATALIWIGLWFLVTKSERLAHRLQIAMAAAGALVLVVAVGAYHVSATPALLASVLAGAGLATPHARRALERLRASRTAEQSS